jgi:hypothetical protein
MLVQGFDRSVESSVALAGLLSKAWNANSDLLEEQFEEFDSDDFSGVVSI